MKRILIIVLAVLPYLAFAQLGVKAGVNFADVKSAESINTSNRTGFHAGVMFTGSFKSILSSRTELLYSRQGYNFDTQSNTGKIDLEYLLLPQMFGINITPLFQVQAGGQLSYLLNAKIDSTSNTGNNTADKILDIVNRFDFSLGGGVEVHPLSQLIIGARINFGLARLFKDPDDEDPFVFDPEVNTKTNLFQIYAGLRFGKD